MERLIIEHDGHYKPKDLCHTDLCGEDWSERCVNMCIMCVEGCTECPVQEAFDRLAEYEALEVTPNQIKELDRRYTEKCVQIKEIVKRLEKEAQDAKAHPEISGSYIRAIYIIKEIAEGWTVLTDDKLIELAIKKAEQREEEENNETD